MFWQQFVWIIALLVTNGSDDIFGLFGHLVKEQVDHTQTPLTDMNFLFGAKIVGDLGKVSANEGKSYNVAILGREFQTHLEMVFEQAGVKAE